MRRRRVRQQRTVYRVEQRQELESFFQNNQYPSYQERETLAARLNLQERQIQVWFKNRRAKYRNMQRASQRQDTGAVASTEGPGVGGPAPAPAPAATGRRIPEDPVFASGPGSSGVVSIPGSSGVASVPGFSRGASVPGFSGGALGPGFSGGASVPGFSGVALGPGSSGVVSFPGSSGGASGPGGAAFTGDRGLYNPPLPNAFGGTIAAETSASSNMEARCGPTQDAQNPVPDAATAAASAPDVAPVWPEESYTLDFSSDLAETPTLADLLSSQGSLEGPSSLQYGCPESEKSRAEDDSSPKKFLDL